MKASRYIAPDRSRHASFQGTTSIRRHGIVEFIIRRKQLLSPNTLEECVWDSEAHANLFDDQWIEEKRLPFTESDPENRR